MRDVEAVRRSLDHLEAAARDQLSRPLTEYLKGDDLVSVAVDNQGWYGDLLQIGPEVGRTERFDALLRGAR